jgi:DNA-binding CsgD family transcriptional regulator
VWGSEPDRLAAVLAALEAAPDGTAAVVLEGTPGTGRSTLLAAVEDHERHRSTPPVVLRARASRRERTSGLGVVRQLLRTRPGGSDRPAAGPSTADPVESTGWLMADLAEGSPGGLLVLVDDAEHADDASLDVLRALQLRRPAGCRLLLSTARAEASPVLTRLRAEGTALRLAPLSPARVAQLVRQRCSDATPEYVAECLRVTGGIPLLLAALLAAPPGLEDLDAAVPDAIRRRIGAELAGLPPAAGLLARLAAVLAAPVGLPDAMALTGLGRRAAGSAADDLAAAGLFRSGEPLSFAQPLLAAAVRAGIPPHGRSALHRQAALLLAGRCADPDVVDAHLLQSFPSGEPWVAERLVQAAHRAEDRHDPASVVRLLARAASEPPRPDRLVHVLVALAAAKMAVGDASAAEDLQQALRLPGPPALGAHARELLAQLHHLRGRSRDGLSLLEGEVAGLGADVAGRGPLLARYLSMTGLDLRTHRQADQLLETLVAAARRGELPADPGVAAHLAWRLAVVAAPPQLVLAAVARAFAVDPLVDPESQGSLVGFAVRALLAVDRPAAAEEACTRALLSAQARGMLLGVGFAHYHRALSRFATGALDGALADVLAAGGPARQGWHRADPWRGELTARIFLARGDRTAATAALALPEAPPATALGSAFVAEARARLALAEDRPREAAELADQAGSCLRELGQDVPALLPWRLVAARAARRAQRPERAQALAEEGVALARRYPAPSALGAALLVAGEVAPAGRRVGLLEEARSVLTGSPALLTRAEALVGLGRALRQAGAWRQARDPLRQGLDLARGLGALPLVQTAREELVAAGARPRRDRLSGPASLTPAQRRVADLAAAGRTNAGIGAELSVDRKTVESHLAQVYRKLGITGRRELTAALGSDLTLDPAVP